MSEGTVKLARTEDEFQRVLVDCRKWKTSCDAWHIEADSRMNQICKRDEQIFQLRADFTRVTAERNAMREERDGLAVILERTDKAFERYANHHGSTCDKHNCTDEAASGECELCDIDRGARSYGQSAAAILLARDQQKLAEGRRAGALWGVRAMRDNFAEYAIGGDPAVPKAIKMCEEFAAAIEAGTVEVEP